MSQEYSPEYFAQRGPEWNNCIKPLNYYVIGGAMGISKETKGKISETLKQKYKLGVINCGFKKGYTPYNKGKKTPREIIEKALASRKGYRHSKETKEKIEKSWEKRQPMPSAYGKRYREKVLPLAMERDNYKCVECGSQKNLRVHHKDFNPSNNLLENLETICNTHHAARHDWGRKKGEVIISPEQREKQSHSMKQKFIDNPDLIEERREQSKKRIRNANGQFV